MGKVELGRRRAARGGAAHVRHHAHDLLPRRCVGAARAGLAAGDAPAHGTLSRESDAGQLLVDDHDLRRAPPVLGGQVASGAQGDPHRLEIARAHDLEVRLGHALQGVLGVHGAALGDEPVRAGAGGQRQLGDEGGFHRGPGAKPFDHRLEGAGHPLVIGIALAGESDPRRQQALRVESQRGAREVHPGPHEKAGAREQRDRERDLRGHEQASQSVSAAPARDRPAAFAEAGAQVHARRVERRGEPEEHARDEPGQGREHEDPAVDPRRFEAGDAFGSGGHEQPSADLGHGDPQGSGETPEEQALREELPHDPGAARPHRGAHRELALPRRPPSEQEVGRVGAGDEEDQPHRAQEERQPLPVVAHHLVEQRRGRHPAVCVVARVITYEVADDTLQVGPGLGERHVGPESAVEAQEVLVVHGAALGGEGDGHPELLARGDGIERLRHHPDDLAGDPGDPDPPSHDLRVRAEPALEEAMAEHHDTVVPGRVLFGREGAAPGGRKAEEREVVVGRRRSQDALGDVAVGQVEGPVVDGGERRVRALVLADVEVVAGGGASRRAAPGGVHRVEPLRFREGQGLEHDGAEDAVDRGGRPDAEGEREHGHRGESRGPGHLPSREREVLPELAPPLAAPLPGIPPARDLPALLPCPLEIGEAALRRPPGRRGIHPRRLRELARAHLEVELELVVHLALDGGPEQAGEPVEGQGASPRLRRGGGRGKPRPRTRPTPSSPARAAFARRG